MLLHYYHLKYNIMHENAKVSHILDQINKTQATSLSRLNGKQLTQTPQLSSAT
jgi:hypothetical protein